MAQARHVVQHGIGAANTALVFHAKRILSLYESDLPFAVSCCTLLAVPGSCSWTFAAVSTSGANQCSNDVASLDAVICKPGHRLVQH